VEKGGRRWWCGWCCGCCCCWNGGGDVGDSGGGEVGGGGDGEEWSAKEGTDVLGCCRLLEGEGKKENQREKERRVYKYKGVVDYYKLAIESKGNEIRVWAKES